MGFLEKIYNKYFCVNLKDYPGFEVDLEINKFLLLITVGIIAALFISYNYQSKVCTIVKKLFRSGAIGEDKAKPLSALNLESNEALKKLLEERKGSLGIIVRVATDENALSHELEKSHESEESEITADNARENSQDAQNSPLAAESGSDDTLADKDANKPENAKICGVRRYYIPTEMKERAERQLGRGNGSLLTVVLYSALLLLICAALIFAMPSLLGALSAA